MRIKKWIIDNTHYLIYLTCAVGLFVINLIRVNGTGAQWAFANEFMGLILFVIICVRTGVKGFLRLRTAIITIVFGAGFPFYFRHFSLGIDYDYQIIGRYVNYFILSLLAIHLFDTFFKNNKEYIKKLRLSAVGVIWILLMIVCIVSRNESKWPLWILIAFGSLYLEPADEAENKVLLKAIVDGIIICFFVFQSLAFLYCPYDIPGYIGFFSNSDCNAKFYTVSYIGFLMKYSMLRREGKRIRFVFFLFSGAMWGFLVFTIMRSGIIGMGLLTIAYLTAEEIMAFKTGIKGFLARGLQLFLIMIVAIPIIYVCIRYIPALRHHPIFNGAYSEERVHSWDPIDSEKYISPTEFLEFSFGGKLGFLYSTPESDYTNDERIKSVSEQFEKENGHSFDGIAIVKTMANDGERVLEYEDRVSPGFDEAHPMYIKISYNGRFENLLGIRKYIFAGYIMDMKLMGNKEEFPSYWITCERCYTSSHCTFIDFASRYGYVAGVLYLLLILVAIGTDYRIIKKSVQTKNESLNASLWELFSLIILVACVGWGAFYSLLFFGEVLESLFWFAMLPLVRNNKEISSNVGR